MQIDYLGLKPSNIRTSLPGALSAYLAVKDAESCCRRGEAAIFVKNQWLVEKPPKPPKPCCSTADLHLRSGRFPLQVLSILICALATNANCRMLRVSDSHVTVNDSGRKLSFPHNQANYTLSIQPVSNGPGLIGGCCFFRGNYGDLRVLQQSLCGMASNCQGR